MSKPTDNLADEGRPVEFTQEEIGEMPTLLALIERVSACADKIRAIGAPTIEVPSILAGLDPATLPTELQEEMKPGTVPTQELLQKAEQFVEWGQTEQAGEVAKVMQAATPQWIMGKLRGAPAEVHAKWPREFAGAIWATLRFHYTNRVTLDRAANIAAFCVLPDAGNRLVDIIEAGDMLRTTYLEVAQILPQIRALLEAAGMLDTSRKESGAANNSPPARGSKGPLGDLLCFSSNTLTGKVLISLIQASAWSLNPTEEFSRGIEQNASNLNMVVGLPNGETATLWEFLARRGANSVKAHFALWSLWHEAGGDPRERVVVKIGDFCKALGYAKHAKGGYRREHKIEAVRIMEALCRVELRAKWWRDAKDSKGEGKRVVRLRGPLWQKGFIAEEGETITYDGLFDESTEVVVPTGFTFAPGDWFLQDEWRRYNRAIGKVGTGLLTLDSRRDEWAVLLGGYLATQMRANQYATLTRRVGTLLKGAHLAQSERAQWNATETLGKLEAALDKLHEKKVIGPWTWADVDTSEPDMDDAESLAAYGKADPNPSGDWQDRLVRIELCFPEDEMRLKEAHQKHLANSQAETARRARKKAAMATGEAAPA